MAGDEGRDVSPDGSPIPVYLALPFGDAPSIVHDAVPAGATILELGCGVGRLTRPLVGLGHRVVAVDDSPEMLEHVTGAETLCGDLFTLDLGRTFDAVLAASHLVDVPERERRLELLEVCRRHITADGVVVFQRHDPEWARDPADSEGLSGPVALQFRLLEHRGETFDAAVTYTVGERSWTQSFTAAVLEDDILAEDAETGGLRLDRWLDDRRSWGLLVPRQ